MRSAEQDRLRVVAAITKQRAKLNADRAAKVEVVQSKQAARVEKISTQVVTFRRQLRYQVGTRRRKASIILKPVVSKPS